MNNPPFAYTKLPARRKGLFFSSTLWLGDDHMLSVRNTRFQETYSRYFYKDIQAIEMRKTVRLNIPPLLPVLLFLLGVPALTVAIGSGVKGGLIIVGVMLAVIAWLIFVAVCRSCICHVVTRVGRDELPALIRTQASIIAVDLIVDRVKAAQGEMVENWQQKLTAVQPSTASPGPEKIISQKPSLWPGFYFAAASILLMFLDGVITVTNMDLVPVHAPPWVGNGNLLLQVFATVAFIMATSRFSGLRNLRIAVIVSTAFTGGISYLSYIVSMAAASVNQRDRAIVLAFSKGIGFVNIAGDLILTIVAVLILLQSYKLFRRNATG